MAAGFAGQHIGYGINIIMYHFGFSIATPATEPVLYHIYYRMPLPTNGWPASMRICLHRA